MSRGNGSVYKRGETGEWWISYYVSGVRKRERGGKTKDLALRLLNKRQREVIEGKIHQRSTALTIGDLRDRFLHRKQAEGKRSLAADRQRFDALVEHFGGDRRQVASITNRDVQALREALALTVTRRGAPMRPATINRHVALLRSALRMAEDDGFLVTVTPSSLRPLAERNKRDRICRADEFDRLTAAANPSLALAIRLSFFTGMRMGE